MGSVGDGSAGNVPEEGEGGFDEQPAIDGAPWGMSLGALCAQAAAGFSHSNQQGLTDPNDRYDPSETDDMEVRKKRARMQGGGSQSTAGALDGQRWAPRLGTLKENRRVISSIRSLHWRMATRRRVLRMKVMGLHAHPLEALRSSIAGQGAAHDCTCDAWDWPLTTPPLHYHTGASSKF